MDGKLGEGRRDLFLLSSNPHRFITLGSAGDKVFNTSVLSQLTKLPLKTNTSQALVMEREDKGDVEPMGSVLGKRSIDRVLEEGAEDEEEEVVSRCGRWGVPGGMRHHQLTIEDVILVEGQPMMTTGLIHMGFGLSRFQPYGQYVKAYADSKELASLSAAAMARARGQWGFEVCELDEHTGALLLSGKKKGRNPIPLSHTVTSRGVLHIPDEEIKNLVMYSGMVLAQGGKVFLNEIITPVFRFYVDWDSLNLSCLTGEQIAEAVRLMNEVVWSFYQETRGTPHERPNAKDKVYVLGSPYKRVKKQGSSCSDPVLYLMKTGLHIIWDVFVTERQAVRMAIAIQIRLRQKYGRRVQPCNDWDKVVDTDVYKNGLRMAGSEKVDTCPKYKEEREAYKAAKDAEERSRRLRESTPRQGKELRTRGASGGGGAEGRGGGGSGVKTGGTGGAGGQTAKSTAQDVDMNCGFDFDLDMVPPNPAIHTDIEAGPGMAPGGRVSSTLVRPGVFNGAVVEVTRRSHSETCPLKCSNGQLNAGRAYWIEFILDARSGRRDFEQEEVLRRGPQFVLMKTMVRLPKNKQVPSPGFLTPKSLVREVEFHPKVLDIDATYGVTITAEDVRRADEGPNQHDALYLRCADFGSTLVRGPEVQKASNAMEDELGQEISLPKVAAFLHSSTTHRSCHGGGGGGGTGSGSGSGTGAGEKGRSMGRHRATSLINTSLMDGDSKHRTPWAGMFLHDVMADLQRKKQAGRMDLSVMNWTESELHNRIEENIRACYPEGVYKDVEVTVIKFIGKNGLDVRVRGEGSCYCHIRGREHESNHVHFRIFRNEGVMKQLCYSSNKPAGGGPSCIATPHASIRGVTYRDELGVLLRRVFRTLATAYGVALSGGLSEPLVSGVKRKDQVKVKDSWGSGVSTWSNLPVALPASTPAPPTLHLHPQDVPNQERVMRVLQPEGGDPETLRLDPTYLGDPATVCKPYKQLKEELHARERSQKKRRTRRVRPASTASATPSPLGMSRSSSAASSGSADFGMDTYSPASMLDSHSSTSDQLPVSSLTKNMAEVETQTKIYINYVASIPLNLLVHTPLRRILTWTPWTFLLAVAHLGAMVHAASVEEVEEWKRLRVSSDVKGDGGHEGGRTGGQRLPMDLHDKELQSRQGLMEDLKASLERLYEDRGMPLPPTLWKSLKTHLMNLLLHPRRGEVEKERALKNFVNVLM